MVRPVRRILLSLVALNASWLVLSAQAPSPVDTRALGEMRWRMIGPHRASRTKAVDGIAGQPHTFFIGVVNGGVWKTTDAGRTWNPIFDDQPTGSIGSIAVAPSRPNVIYVGAGEGQQRPDLATGDGMYKSIDGGKTWAHLGLRDTQQIAHIAVDPNNPDRLFVAALGHPYGPNAERGIFRSLDGGQTFQKVLYKDENTGGSDVTIDPKDPNTVYAVPLGGAAGALGERRLPRARQRAVQVHRRRHHVAATDQRACRRGTAIAGPHRHHRRAEPPVAPVRDRGGALDRRNLPLRRFRRELVSRQQRSARRGPPGDACEVRVHPTNPDIVYVPTIVTWKSTDGGKTFTAFRGAPGGDDYQKIWINPTMPDVMIITSDQGAIVTLNGGASWSSWYNQPTAAFYHVTTDNAFPYRVCSGQQESGSVCISSRGDDGQITFREWHPVGVEEYGYVAPDPLDPDIVYGGKVSRYDRRTGQVQNITPKPLRAADYRVVRTMPLLFSPVDPKKLYFSSNTLWKTTTGGDSWEQISPDLTRKKWEVPGNVGKYIAPTPPGQPARRDLHDRAVVPRREHHLGRHRRRPHPRDRDAGKTGRM